MLAVQKETVRKPACLNQHSGWKENGSSENLKQNLFWGLIHTTSVTQGNIEQKVQIGNVLRLLVPPLMSHVLPFHRC